MATKKEMAEQLGLDPADYKHAELVDLVKEAEGNDGSDQQTTGFKAHEVKAFERIIRKAVKKDGSGFRKDISETAKLAAKVALKRLGRTKVEWDRSIDLNQNE